METNNRKGDFTGNITLPESNNTGLTSQNVMQMCDYIYNNIPVTHKMIYSFFKKQYIFRFSKYFNNNKNIKVFSSRHIVEILRKNHKK